MMVTSFFGVDEYNISVAAFAKTPFFKVKPKIFAGLITCDMGKFIQTDSAVGHTCREDKRHSGFNTRSAARAFGEVIFPFLLIAVEVKRTMVCGYDREGAILDLFPKGVHCELYCAATGL